MGLVFVGNSGAARECYWVLEQARKLDQRTPPFKGFLAWHNYRGQLCDLEQFFLGNSDEYNFKPDDQFVIAVGKPSLRKEIYSWLIEKGAKFFTLIHPDTYICPSAVIGEANIFAGKCSILANARIGNANFFNGGISVGHDSIIGNANTCNLLTSFFGESHVGNCNHFAPFTLILEHSRIGSHNSFAPGSVVYRGCGDYCHMSGNPALIERRLKTIPND